MVTGNKRCCYQCKDRHFDEIDGKTVTCHATCKKFLAEKAENDKFKADQQVKQKELSFRFENAERLARRRKVTRTYRTN